jgi:hypothetical protein
MPPSPVVVEVPACVAPRPSASLACAGNFEVDRLLGEAGAKPDVGAAFLAIAFERIAAYRSAEEEKIIEIRQPPLGAEAANVVDAGRGGAADLRQREFIEGCRRARRGAGGPIHQ